ncbi:LysM peptidoglycan-binding domain-containing protein [Pontiellaceae bacterium B12219]|nr:LysM peptidoglycan-binding domain-containing protein [Pontiellaceae bacterium B12219]
MKIGSAVFAVHVAVISMFALTQGCVTTESQGSGRGVGAKHRGPFKHEHKGKSASDMEGTSVAIDPYGAYEEDTTMVYDDAIILESTSTYVEPSKSSAPYGQTEIYIVQKGDMLSQLAVDFDTTTATLVEMNGLSNPDVLYVGQELSVPAGRKNSKTTSKPTGSVKKGGSYIIQKGDTLSEIALAAGVSIDDLRSLNGIKGDTIMAGEELSIPSYGKVPAASRSKKSTTTTKTKSTPAKTTEPVAPAPEPAAPVFEPAAAPVSAAPMEVDMVVDDVMYPGETLDDKARNYGVSKAEIMRLNGISSESQVREGMTIRIPVAE